MPAITHWFRLLLPIKLSLNSTIRLETALGMCFTPPLLSLYLSLLRNPLKRSRFSTYITMKKKKDVNPLRALWQKMIIDGNMSIIAKRYRMKIDLPVNGCDYTEESYEDWYKKHIGNSKIKEQKRIDICTQFCDEVIQKISPRYFVDEIKLRLLLINFFFNGSIDLKSITSENGLLGVFKTLWIKGGKRRFPSGKIEDGVYIKIGPYSSIDSIKKYVTRNTKLIKENQKVFLYSKNLPPSIKLYSSKNYERDTKIELFNQFTKQDLKDFGVDKIYKEEQIAFIMNNKYGYKEVDDNIVKIALHRRRRAKNSLLK